MKLTPTDIDTLNTAVSDLRADFISSGKKDPQGIRITPTIENMLMMIMNKLIDIENAIKPPKP